MDDEMLPKCTNEVRRSGRAHAVLEQVMDWLDTDPVFHEQDMMEFVVAITDGVRHVDAQPFIELWAHPKMMSSLQSGAFAHRVQARYHAAASVSSGVPPWLCAVVCRALRTPFLRKRFPFTILDVFVLGKIHCVPLDAAWQTHADAPADADLAHMWAPLLQYWQQFEPHVDDALVQGIVNVVTWMAECCGAMRNASFDAQMSTCMLACSEPSFVSPRVQEALLRSVGKVLATGTVGRQWLLTFTLMCFRIARPVKGNIGMPVDVAEAIFHAWHLHPLESYPQDCEAAERLCALGCWAL